MFSSGTIVCSSNSVNNYNDNDDNGNNHVTSKRTWLESSRPPLYEHEPTRPPRAGRFDQVVRYDVLFVALGLPPEVGPLHASYQANDYANISQDSRLQIAQSTSWAVLRRDLGLCWSPAAHFGILWALHHDSNQLRQQQANSSEITLNI